jgi:outer membrane protein
MRRFAAVAVLSLMLAAAPSFAQGTQTPPPAPAGQQPKPAPAAPQTATPPPPVAMQAPRPFPEGAKIAYINIQRVANESNEGKAATAKVQALSQKKVAELGEKNKALQADQQKLQTGGLVLSDQARAELERKIERQNTEIQRAQQDAQQEVQELQQELQNEFQRKLMPIVQQVFDERGLHMLFSAADAGIVLANPGLDLTAEVIKRFDAAPATTAAPAAKPPAAAAPPAQTPPAGQKPPATKPPGR